MFILEKKDQYKVLNAYANIANYLPSKKYVKVVGQEKEVY